MRNGERFKELANKRRHLRPKRSKTQKKDTVLPIRKKKRIQGTLRGIVKIPIFF